MTLFLPVLTVIHNATEEATPLQIYCKSVLSLISAVRRKKNSNHFFDLQELPALDLPV